MRKSKMMFLLFGIFLVLSGCHSGQSLLDDSINPDEIDKIQVVLAMGNPEYGAPSKIIMDRDEIEQMVYAFNEATIGDKVADDDVGVAFASTYYFFKGDLLIYQFSFNGNDSERIWMDSNWYSISYPDQTPFELYQGSNAVELVVDENLNEIMN